MQQPRSGHVVRVRRWRFLAAALGLLALPLAAGVAYQRISIEIGARRHPAPGRLVAVDGHRMHLDCTGSGSPTVVLEAALGGTWMDWSLVQPEVAAFTRVCSYDHSGLGWSESGPEPRTSRQIAAELHTLLAAAGEVPPFLVVGHSAGGYHVRVFAGLFPDDVAGVVLVDAAHEQMFERLPAEVTAGLADFADLVREQRRMMFTGLPRLRGLCGQAPGVLEHLAGAFAFNGCRTSFLRTLEQELDVIRTDAIEVAQAGGLGDLPLVVVTRDFTLPDFDLPEDVSLQAMTVGLELQRELAALSSRGQLVTADRSGHYVPFDRPDVVTQAIRDVTDDVRRR